MFRISETILKTGQFELMQAWYRRALELEVLFEHSPEGAAGPGDFGGQTRATDLRMCFFRVASEFPFTQMIGIFQEPGTATAPVKGAPGLHHMQMMASDFEALICKYETLARAGMKPHRSSNHGIMTSFYYRDPDGNNVEFTAQNFPSLEALDIFMKSAYFKRNPSGVEIPDAAAFVARYRAGVPVTELTCMPELPA